jgi:hypothetical protein
MVLFDAGILIKLLDPRTPDSQREKLDYLIATLQKTKTKILIPTPALSEFYVKADPDVVAIQYTPVGLIVEIYECITPLEMTWN